MKKFIGLVLLVGLFLGCNNVANPNNPAEPTESESGLKESELKIEALSSNSVYISWNDMSVSKKYEITRSTSRYGLYIPIAIVSTTKYIDTNDLSPSSTYHYRVIKNPRPEGRGIEDFSLKSLRMWGNTSPTPPVLSAPRGGELNP